MAVGKKNINSDTVKWIMRYVKTNFKAVRQAVEEVKETNIAKFEAQNEWRQQFKDQMGSFSRKEDLAGLQSQIDDLKKVKSNLEGRVWMMGITWILLTAIASIATWYLSTRK